jgi:hypothetical protein
MSYKKGIREAGMTCERRARRKGVMGPLYWNVTGYAGQLYVHGKRSAAQRG